VVVLSTGIEFSFVPSKFQDYAGERSTFLEKFESSRRNMALYNGKWRISARHKELYLLVGR
jgi:hypothetical protein